MTVQQKKILYLVVGILISVVLLWLLFRDIQFAELVDALKGANYWWLIPNVVLIVITMYQRAYRWHFMVLPIKTVRFPKLLAATCIGFMANNVLPLRLGEFVRAYSLAHEEEGITKSASLATIFVERMIFDLVALLLIFGAVVSQSELALSEDMKDGLKIVVGLALVGISFMLLLAVRADSTGRLLSRYMFFLPSSVREKVHDLVLKFSRGLDFLKSIKSLIMVTLHTLMIWFLLGISNIFVFWAFGFDIPLEASFVLLVVVSISILIPSSPGFVGVYHFGAVWSLEQYGIARADAISCALVLHAAQYTVVTLMGFYFLHKEHLSLRKLEEEATSTT